MTQEIPGTALLDRATMDNPYPLYRRLQAESPVWRVPGSEVFLVTSYELLDEAAKRVEDFSSNMRCLLYRDENGLPGRLGFGEAGMQALATADPPVHTVHRHTVFPEFVGKRMSLLAPEIEEVAAACVASAVGKGRTDFMAEVGNRVPITIISRLIGFKGSDLDTLLQTAFDSTSLVGGALSQQQLFETIGRIMSIGTWVAEQLEAADGTEDDILTSIKRGVEAGALNPQEAAGILQTLLAAGGESTTSLLGNAVRMLAEDVPLQQRLRADPELVPAFLEEALRLESPFRSMLRSVPRDTTLGGVEVPEGSTVLMFWSAGNRDPAAFENPEQINLERPRRHMTFGRGIHLCVGAPLARLEGKTVITELLARTSHIALDPDQPPEWVQSLQVRRHDRLPVILTPR